MEKIKKSKYLMVKGSVIITIPLFIKKEFSKNQYSTWLNGLPTKSKKIFKKKIIVEDWYPAKEGLILPTQKICELFYNNDLIGAWKCGNYSAEYIMNRFFRIILKFKPPQFIIDRASSILPTYYSSGKITVIEASRYHCLFKLSDFQDMHEIIEQRLAGWIENAFILGGFKVQKVRITKSIKDHEPYSEILAVWD